MRNYDDGAIILVGDDEVAMRQVLNAQLSARGHSVYEAGTGAEILRTVSVLEPDVILLDLGLPDIDGIEVTSVYAARRRHQSSFFRLGLQTLIKSPRWMRVRMTTSPSRIDLTSYLSASEQPCFGPRSKEKTYSRPAILWSI